MAMRKFRFDPEPQTEREAMLRLASGDEMFVASPVHDLHHQLGAVAQYPAEGHEPLYPGWIRLTFPLVASGLLWLAIWSLVRQLI